MDYWEKYKELGKNLKNIDNTYYRNECERLRKEMIQYNDKYYTLFKAYNPSIVSRQYSVGGEGFHRGYYMPSPTYDLVVGNCNRGKLLKRVSPSSKIAFEYCFDINNQLIMIIENPNTAFEHVEYIIYEQERTLGITFDRDKEINVISECEYDHDNIISYIRCECRGSDESIYFYYKEIYHYNQNQLFSTNSYSYTPKINLLTHQEYTFQHDTEGYLASYEVIDHLKYIKPFVKDSETEKQIYKVYKKRRI